MATSANIAAEVPDDVEFLRTALSLRIRSELNRLVNVTAEIAGRKGELVDFMGKVVILAVVAWLCFEAWPIYSVYFWLGAFIAGTYGLVLATDRLQRTRLAQQRPQFSDALGKLLRELANVGRNVCIGIGLVAVIQIVLSFWPDDFDPDHVKEWERWLSEFREFVEVIVGLKALLVSAVVLSTFSVVLSRTGFLRAFLKAREKLGVVLHVLIALTAFTFFSSTSTAEMEHEWIARMANREKSVAQEIQQEKRKIVAAAIIVDHVSNMPPAEQRSLNELFNEVERTNDKSLIKYAADRITPSLRSFDSSDVRRPSDPNPDAEAQSSTKIRLRDAGESYAGVMREKQEITKSFDAAREVTKASLRALMPGFGIGQPFVDSFVDTAVDTFSGSRLTNRTFDRSVKDLDSAKLLIHEYGAAEPWPWMPPDAQKPDKVETGNVLRKPERRRGSWGAQDSLDGAKTQEERESLERFKQYREQRLRSPGEIFRGPRSRGPLR